MADNQTPGTASAASKSGSAASAEAIEAGRRAAEAAERQTEKAARVAEQVIDKTAEASEETVRAIGTAQDAWRASLEAGARSVEGLSQTMSRTFGIAAPDGELAERSAQNVRAISQASTALAKGAQEASRVWFELVQQGLRTNLEALSELAQCRTMQDVITVQSQVMRRGLERAVDGGQTIARSSAQAIEEANRALHSGPG